LVTSVLIETSSRLAAQPPGVDHFDQQWTRPVLGIAEAAMQYAHDIEANVEADEIR
jgi:hypothetical protein